MLKAAGKRIREIVGGQSPQKIAARQGAALPVPTYTIPLLLSLPNDYGSGKVTLRFTFAGLRA